MMSTTLEHSLFGKGDNFGPGIKDTAMNVIAQLSIPVALPAGTRLFADGETATSFYILDEGTGICMWSYGLLIVCAMCK
jgi:CRP-like cAMP-binding protein